MESVIVTVKADGSVKVEAQGVKGSGCKALTKAIEDSLGVVTSDVKKPEFYQQANQQAGMLAKAGAR